MKRIGHQVADGLQLPDHRGRSGGLWHHPGQPRLCGARCGGHARFQAKAQRSPKDDRQRSHGSHVAIWTTAAADAAAPVPHMRFAVLHRTDCAAHPQLPTRGAKLASKCCRCPKCSWIRRRICPLHGVGKVPAHKFHLHEGHTRNKLYVTFLVQLMSVTHEVALLRFSSPRTVRMLHLFFHPTENCADHAASDKLPGKNCAGRHMQRVRCSDSSDIGANGLCRLSSHVVVRC
jgi:hypothetical protein